MTTLNYQPGFRCQALALSTTRRAGRRRLLISAPLERRSLEPASVGYRKRQSASGHFRIAPHERRLAARERPTRQFIPGYGAAAGWLRLDLLGLGARGLGTLGREGRERIDLACRRGDRVALGRRRSRSSSSSSDCRSRTHTMALIVPVHPRSHRRPSSTPVAPSCPRRRPLPPRRGFSALDRQRFALHVGRAKRERR
jgi:hypothetical protein